MDIFHVTLEEPGVPADSLQAGFEGVIEFATILVGPDKTPFQLPLKHAIAIPYFAKAFDGNFVESKTKTIEMEDEEPETFRLFITWMYRGLADAGKLNVTVPAWTRLMIMADKLCIRSLADGLARHITNQTAVPEVLHGETDGDGIWGPICEGYHIASDHKYRYVFVKSAYDIVERRDLQEVLEAMASDQFCQDYLSWTHLVRRCDKWHITGRDDINLKQHQFLVEDDGDDHDERSVSSFALSAVLFPGEEFPDLFHDWSFKRLNGHESKWVELRIVLRI